MAIDTNKKPLTKALRAGGIALLLAFVYQNCSNSGFQAVSVPQTSNSLTPTTPDDPTGGTITDPTVASKIAGNELVPLTVDLWFMKVYESVTLSQLPTGMVYDATARRLYWLPKKGQAGSYKVAVAAKSETGTTTRYLQFDIGAMTDTTLRSGPPGIYQDDEVGYVFVHGAGGADRCQDYKDLEAYWGSFDDIVAPNANNRLVACYDGRRAVADTAAGVAHQILNASCGRYNLCIVITHSMGGLMMEHMFTHAREATSADANASLYNNWRLYKQVRDKTLFVISLGSAAGGSKVASMVDAPENHEALQFVIGNISEWLGQNDASTKNLVVTTAMNKVAPFREDPLIPFFMVPGYSMERLDAGIGDFLGSIWDYLFGNDLPVTVFQGDASLAVIDDVAEFRSRSDGLVDFRSACGVANDEENDGPGVNASLDQQFSYCFSAPKKPNHFPWFVSNLNHYLLSVAYGDCNNTKNPCTSRFVDYNQKTFIENTQYRGKNVPQVIRDRLTANRAGASPQTVQIKVSW